MTFVLNVFRIFPQGVPTLRPGRVGAVASVGRAEQVSSQNAGDDSDEAVMGNEEVLTLWFLGVGRELEMKERKEAQRRLKFTRKRPHSAHA